MHVGNNEPYGELVPAAKLYSRFSAEPARDEEEAARVDENGGDAFPLWVSVLALVGLAGGVVVSVLAGQVSLAAAPTHVALESAGMAVSMVRAPLFKDDALVRHRKEPVAQAVGPARDLRQAAQFRPSIRNLI